MFKIVKILIAFSAFAAVGTSLAGAVDYKQIRLDALEAKKMSRSEVLRLYKNKTWVWANGGGYFSDGLRFTAITNESGVETYAAGHWFMTVSNKVCFRAIWTSSETRVADIKCYTHRKAGDTIYQRGTGGKWYVFKSDVTLDEDEYSKLVEGNLIAEELMAKKMRIAEARSSN